MKSATDLDCYEPLDQGAHRILAEALGDTPETAISVHLLRRGFCLAFVAGEAARFEGAIVQGITLEDGRFAGGMFDWLTPFSFVVGCSLVWGYMLLGSTWLVIKSGE